MWNGCKGSGNHHGGLNLSNAQCAGGIISQAGISRPRRKARRGCLSCQQSHRTCGDERPCNTCIGRGIGHTCFDGFREKPKYLEDSKGAPFMGISPSVICSNIPLRIGHNEQQEMLQAAATPGKRSPLLNPNSPARSDKKICPFQNMPPSYGYSVEESTSTMDPNDADDWSDMPDNHSGEDPASWDILNRQKTTAECDLRAELDGQNAGSQLGFVIKAGWSSTFL